MTMPQAFNCPITLNMMEDPWSDIDGNSYEKNAIFQWVQQNGISPITRNPMSLSDLKPNRALKDLIQAYLGNPESIVPPLIKSSFVKRTTQREPAMIIMIADTSGSMDEICSNKNSSEKMNFTRLDLVKHTMRTIIESLGEDDSLGLVQFNSSAKALTNIVNLTESNKKVFHDKVNELRPAGGTNIWDALRVSIELGLTKMSETNCINLLLFTDGESNNDPPRGIIPTLNSFLNGCPSLNMSINTFGFGNNINSNLLYTISQQTPKSIFGFIPDSTMIGTVFINSLAHILTKTDSSNLTQSDEVIKSKLIELIRNQFSNRNQEDLLSFISELDAQSPFVRDLVLDINPTSDENFGQIFKALDSAYFSKWGQHYLYSVLSAYQNNFCLNFKDNGVQHFKTKNFELIQQFIENIFVKMEPPQPTGIDYNSSGCRPVHVTSQMFTQSFYNQNGGCFTGDSLIKVVENKEEKYIRVDKIVPGSKVVAHCGEATVKLVVRFKFTGHIRQYGTTGITPYHPVKFENNDWKFPIDLESFSDSYITDEYVYDFILDKNHTVELNGFYAVTLNHGIFDTDIVSHDYFGTNRVENDFMKHPSYQSGYITLEEFEWTRDIMTQRVCKLKF
jgi:hypothetical protein